MITYPALFEYDEEEKVYNVRFPDLPGCFTYRNLRSQLKGRLRCPLPAENLVKITRFSAVIIIKLIGRRGL